MVNSIKIAGYVTIEPTSYNSKGNMCSFSICNKQNDFSHFFKVISFNQLSETTKLLKKGDLVYVEGTLRSRKWENRTLIEICASSIEKQIRTPRTEPVNRPF